MPAGATCDDDDELLPPRFCFRLCLSFLIGSLPLAPSPADVDFLCGEFFLALFGFFALEATELDSEVEPEPLEEHDEELDEDGDGECLFLFLPRCLGFLRCFLDTILVKVRATMLQ